MGRYQLSSGRRLVGMWNPIGPTTKTMEPAPETIVVRGVCASWQLGRTGRGRHAASAAGLSRCQPPADRIHPRVRRTAPVVRLCGLESSGGTASPARQSLGVSPPKIVHDSTDRRPGSQRAVTPGASGRPPQVCSARRAAHSEPRPPRTMTGGERWRRQYHLDIRRRLGRGAHRRRYEARSGQHRGGRSARSPPLGTTHR